MATHPHRKLHRSADDRILAGVCGGIAEYFDIDPVLVRIAFVVFS
ncbi:MAG: PspC domain-containing protein, partial [Candidatus Ryanbacteria bacterium]|nr:PspC domain-containing protein [Candidatus Ryanbacteria bacterium]